jgi:hypothetical protein
MIEDECHHAKSNEKYINLDFDFLSIEYYVILENILRTLNDKFIFHPERLTLKVLTIIKLDLEHYYINILCIYICPRASTGSNFKFPSERVKNNLR